MRFQVLALYTSAFSIVALHRTTTAISEQGGADGGEPATDRLHMIRQRTTARLKCAIQSLYLRLLHLNSASIVRTVKQH